MKNRQQMAPGHSTNKVDWNKVINRKSYRAKPLGGEKSRHVTRPKKKKKKQRSFFQQPGFPAALDPS